MGPNITSAVSVSRKAREEFTAEEDRLILKCKQYEETTTLRATNRAFWKNMKYLYPTIFAHRSEDTLKARCARLLSNPKLVAKSKRAALSDIADGKGSCKRPRLDSVHDWLADETEGSASISNENVLRSFNATDSCRQRKDGEILWSSGLLLAKRGQILMNRGLELMGCSERKIIECSYTSLSSSDDDEDARPMLEDAPETSDYCYGRRRETAVVDANGDGNKVRRRTHHEGRQQEIETAPSSIYRDRRLQIRTEGRKTLCLRDEDTTEDEDQRRASEGDDRRGDSRRRRQRLKSVKRKVVPIGRRTAPKHVVSCKEGRGDMRNESEGDGDMRNENEGDGDMRNENEGDGDMGNENEGDGDMANENEADGDMRKENEGDGDMGNENEGDGDMGNENDADDRDMHAHMIESISSSCPSSSGSPKGETKYSNKMIAKVKDGDTRIIDAREMCAREMCAREMCAREMCARGMCAREMSASNDENSREEEESDGVEWVWKIKKEL